MGLSGGGGSAAGGVGGSPGGVGSAGMPVGWDLLVWHGPLLSQAESRLMIEKGVEWVMW